MNEDTGDLECLRCGASVSLDAGYCAGCGVVRAEALTPAPSPKAKRRKPALIVGAVALLVFAGAGAFAAQSLSNPAKQNAQVCEEFAEFGIQRFEGDNWEELRQNIVDSPKTPELLALQRDYFEGAEELAFDNLRAFIGGQRDNFPTSNRKVTDAARDIERLCEEAGVTVPSLWDD